MKLILLVTSILLWYGPSLVQTSFYLMSHLNGLRNYPTLWSHYYVM